MSGIGDSVARAAGAADAAGRALPCAALVAAHARHSVATVMAVRRKDMMTASEGGDCGSLLRDTRDGAEPSSRDKSVAVRAANARASVVTLRDATVLLSLGPTDATPTAGGPMRTSLWSALLIVLTCAPLRAQGLIGTL